MTFRMERTLREYDRYYAFSAPGRIKAIYLARGPTAAGKRSWLIDPEKMPFIFDGGCRQVTVLYDTTTDRLLSVACNGVA